MARGPAWRGKGWAGSRGALVWMEGSVEGGALSLVWVSRVKGVSLPSKACPPAWFWPLASPLQDLPPLTTLLFLESRVSQYLLSLSPKITPTTTYKSAPLNPCSTRIPPLQTPSLGSTYRPWRLPSYAPLPSWPVILGDLPAFICPIIFHSIHVFLSHLPPQHDRNSFLKISGDPVKGHPNDTSLRILLDSTRGVDYYFLLQTPFRFEFDDTYLCWSFYFYVHPLGCSWSPGFLPHSSLSVFCSSNLLALCGFIHHLPTHIDDAKISSCWAPQGPAPWCVAAREQNWCFWWARIRDGEAGCFRHIDWYGN